MGYLLIGASLHVPQAESDQEVREGCSTLGPAKPSMALEETNKSSDMAVYRLERWEPGVAASNGLLGPEVFPALAELRHISGFDSQSSRNGDSSICWWLSATKRSKWLSLAPQKPSLSSQGV